MKLCWKIRAGLGWCYFWRLPSYKQNVCCVQSHVRITFSYNNFHDGTCSIIKMLGVRVQLPGWVTALVYCVCLCARACVWQYVQVWENNCTCYLLTQLSFVWRMLTMHINHTIKTISAFRFFIRESVPLQKLYILVRSAAKVYLYKNCKYWCGLLHTKSVCVCVCVHGCGCACHVYHSG